jgi:hypothetical protein
MDGSNCLSLILLSAPGELSSYIDQPERLGHPASGRDRLHPFGIDYIRCPGTYTRPYAFDVGVGGNRNAPYSQQLAV